MFQVEVKRAEKREPKSRSGVESVPGMNAYQAHLGAQHGYGVGQYAQQGMCTMLCYSLKMLKYKLKKYLMFVSHIY